MEAFTDKNANSASLIVKFFFWKYFTIGISPTFFSLDIDLPFLQRFGFYDEFTPFWYKEIGLGILMGSIIRIFVLAIVGVVQWTIYRYKINYDQG